MELLDEEHRDPLNQMHYEKVKEKEPINYTTHSFKKYENVKIKNFIQALWGMGLTSEQFSQEIERYF